MDKYDAAERYSRVLFRRFGSSRKHLLRSYSCAFFRLINLQQASFFSHSNYLQY